MSNQSFGDNEIYQNKKKDEAKMFKITQAKPLINKKNIFQTTLMNNNYINNKSNNQNRIDIIVTNQNNHLNSNHHQYQKNERYELAFKEFQYTNGMDTGQLNGF